MDVDMRTMRWWLSARVKRVATRSPMACSYCWRQFRSVRKPPAGGRDHLIRWMLNVQENSEIHWWSGLDRVEMFVYRDPTVSAPRRCPSGSYPSDRTKNVLRKFRSKWVPGHDPLDMTYPSCFRENTSKLANSVTHRLSSLDSRYPLKLVPPDGTT